MKYYLVALLDRNSGKIIENATRNLVKKLRPQKKTSYYGVIMEVIEDPDPAKLEQILKDMIKPIRYFKIDVKGNLVFDEDNKTIGLEVVNFGYLKRLSRKFNTMLGLHGFKVRPEESVENTAQLVLFSGERSKELDKVEPVLKTGDDKLFRVDRFELWKNLNFKKESVYTVFDLVDPNII